MASLRSPPIASEAPRRRVVIVGAAGRDFHDFNTVFRDDPLTEVVAITAAQIPGIAGRIYPPVLAGPLYPDGIPIVPEATLEALCCTRRVDQIVFAYSDVSHQHVMHLASRALALGADFVLLGPSRTMLRSCRPVIAVSAVRTGCGKSQIARWIAGRLRDHGLSVVVIRHPMPYGDLAAARVQRFASAADIEAAQCTAEEREEYEPHIAAGGIVMAGVDYAAILRAAEHEAEIIVWDGGNNDFPFIKPDLHIVLADALRPRQIATHHPGEAVARMADVLVINKADAAAAADVEVAATELRAINPGAPIIRAASPVRLDDPSAVRGRRVVIVEDGPTITHGGMPFGAGFVAATAAGAAEIIDPRPAAAPTIAAAFAAYPHIGKVLPALGYRPEQLRDLADTIDAIDADVVVAATPTDLVRLLHPAKPVIRARYEFAGMGETELGAVIDHFLAGLPRRSCAAAAATGARP